MRNLMVVIRATSAAVILLCGLAAPAAAQEGFLGEIRWVAFSYAPKGWAECNGQLLPINQNQALFALLGTTYGGNGQTTFALPDMRGRFPIHVGMGPGLTNRTWGEAAGAETHALAVSEMPAHDHAIATHSHSIPALAFDLRASSAAATSVSAAGNVLATASVSGHGNPKVTKIYSAGPADVSLGTGGTTAPAETGSAAGMTSSVGGGASHPTMPPYLGVRCIIALQGIFPPQQ